MTTAAEGLVVALTGELADVNARIKAATSAGVNTAPLMRRLARVELDLAAAKKRLIEEWHSVPSNPYA